MSRRKRSKAGVGAGVLGWIVRTATRRSRLVVVVWIALVALLAMLGRNVESKLTLHPLYVSGSKSKRAHEISLRQFGSDYAVVVMLRGPHADVERQGRMLASRLDAMPRLLVLSPWARGATIDGLSPSPGVAAILVRVEGGRAREITGLLAPVQQQVDESVTGPVHASIAGLPGTIDSTRSAAEDASKVGELIALPVLLLVLLFVFRSVLAALMPVVIGGAVVAATRGLLSLLAGLIPIDLFAIGVVGMLGLALGVDYSLLVVSRFREERETHDLAAAVEATVTGTARSVIPAGCGLILAMVVAPVLIPGTIIRSISIAVIAATLLSMLSAICVVPALLTLLDRNLDRWSLRRRRGPQVAPLRLSRRFVGRPRAVIPILLVLLFLAGWAFTLNSDTLSIAFLPAGDPGRQQQEEVEDTLGPGWVAPMEVIVNGRGSPVTSPDRLRALTAFQRRVERDPGVETMAGLAKIESGARQMGGIEGELAEQQQGLHRLAVGISRAHHGATLNTSGLFKAAQGSSALDAGLGAAHTGAGALAGGLRKTSAGSGRLADGLGSAGEGSGKISQGTTKASSIAGKLTEGLEKARENVGEVRNSAHLFKNTMQSGDARLAELYGPLEGTRAQLAAAWQALRQMTAGQDDPEYAAALRAVEEANRNLTGTDLATGEPSDPRFRGVEVGVKRAEGQFGVGLYLAAKLDKNGRQANAGMSKLAQASSKLHRGLTKLAGGSRRLSKVVVALARGGKVLSPLLSKLSEGAGRLAGVLGQFGVGADQLAGGLGAGAEKSKLLGSALNRMGTGLERQQSPESGGSQLEQLQRRSPGLFRSAYFVLAGLDGSHPDQRTQLGSLINIDRGGADARMLVIPRDDPTSVGAEETKGRIEGDAEALARKTGTEVVLGGVTPIEVDINNELRDQAPILRLALALVGLIVLIPVLRSLVVPILAALINVLTVSASFGVLALLFNGSLLGGPGYVDTTVVAGAMMVMFGLAIDYEVFVFARIREEYVRTGSTSAAIRNGLDQTAHVVTGAATIMIAVFLAFSISEFISIRNFGVAQAVAVFIDAFIVRLIVVPSMMGWLGRWCWWMPRWLDRVLPGRSPAATGMGEASVSPRR